MKTAEQYFREYSETHQNPINKRIHYVCVPLIFWSVMALLWAVPRPWEMSEIPNLNWAILTTIFALLFYLRLGARYFWAMLTASMIVLASCALLGLLGFPLFRIGAIVFVLAWIGQFYGHKVEGKKPSFFNDILFLLIGPLWVIELLRSRSAEARR